MSDEQEIVTAQIGVFEFISDQKFRESLNSDYTELLKSLHYGANKAAHVLAGSIVEALLVDFLISSDYKKRSGKDPLEFDLFKAAEACKSEGILTQRAYDLSSVIRGYRNLIHPGRAIRLRETVDANGARVAKALVDMVIDEVVIARKEKYGFTAEQIVSKIERDHTAMSILRHLLQETSEYERVRLALEVIPQKHFNSTDDPFYPSDALEECFRSVFKLLPDDKKTLVARRFVSILKQQAAKEVLNYEAAFFRGYDLEYLLPDELALVREHLISQLRKDVSVRKLTAVNGLARFLRVSDVDVYFSLLLRTVANGKGLLRGKAREMVVSEYCNLSSVDHKKKALDSVKDWQTMFEEHGNLDWVTEMAALYKEMESEIPF